MFSDFPEEIKSLMLMGKFEEALITIQKEGNKLQEAICLIQIARYRDAISILKTLDKKFDVLIVLAEAHLRLGEDDKASEYIKQMNRDENEFAYLRILAMQHWFRGELLDAKSYAQKAIQIEVNNAFIVNLMGIIELRLGNLRTAIDYFIRIIDIKDAGEQQIAIAIVNTATCYQQIGRLNEALEKYKVGSIILKKIGNQRHYADTLRAIGQIFHRKGEVEKALEYMYTSLEIRNLLNNPLENAESLFWISMVLIDKKSLDKARKIIKELKSIESKVNNDIVTYRYNLANAQLLSQSNRIKNIATSMTIYEQLINQNIVDHELAIISHLAYFEILLKEMQMNHEEEIIAEIQLITDKLLEIAKRQNSKILLAKTYWLQSQVSIIIGDTQLSKTYMMQAMFIADEEGVESLAKKISEQMDKFLQLEEEYSSISIDERIETLTPQIGVLSSQIRMKKELISIEEEEEISVQLLIMSANSGISYFSYLFSEDNNEISHNELFMGSFLNAMQGFSGEVFDRSLDRVKMGEYTILVSTKDGIMYTYIYKGQSYSSQIKLLNLEEEIVKSEIISNGIKVANETGMLFNTTVKSELEKLIVRIF